MVKERVERIRRWLEEHIRLLKTFPTNVDEYVNQLQSLEYIEDNYQSVKDKVDLNSQIFEILEAFDLPAREDKNSRFIDELYQLINTLNTAIYDTKDKADRRKDQIKKKVLKKVPKLNARISEIDNEIRQERYLMIEDVSVVEIQAELAELDGRMQLIIDKKKAIQRYQRTLDMGYVEPFNNAEDTRVLLGYLVRLWHSLHVWRQNIAKWAACPFADIDVAHILEQSTQHSKTVLVCERNLAPESTAV